MKTNPPFLHGLNAAIIGTIMMFSRLADGFTDIFMGYVMDRVKTAVTRKWIRRGTARSPSVLAPG